MTPLPTLSHLLLLIFTVVLSQQSLEAVGDTAQLTTSTQTFQSLIVGLTARIQCSLYHCTTATSGEPAVSDSVLWLKDDLLVFNGTDFQPTSGIEPGNIVLQRSFTTPEDAGEGKRCVTEELTLLLKNLSKKEAGEYRCQVRKAGEGSQPTQQLDFRLDVLGRC